MFETKLKMVTIESKDIMELNKMINEFIEYKEVISMNYGILNDKHYMLITYRVYL